jgi:hypothetical protein
LPGVSDESGTADGTPRCSAKGCRAAARWQLQWRNPRLHDAARRKTWLACDEHRVSLAAFLDARGFLLGVEPLP